MLNLTFLNSRIKILKVNVTRPIIKNEVSKITFKAAKADIAKIVGTRGGVGNFV